MNSQQLELICQRSEAIRSDRALKHALHAINEDNIELKLTIKSMAEAFDGMSSVLEQLMQVNLGMKSQLDAFNAHQRPEDGQASSTRMIGKDE